MRSTGLLTGALGAVAMTAALGGQSRQPPAFKSGVQLLEVDARVFDAAGRFVADLTMDDFEIREKGVPQKIETMFLVGAAAAVPPGGAVPAGTVPRAPQTWIFVFDQRHLLPGGFHRAKVGFDAFMRSRFRAGDLVGIVMNDTVVNNRITSERSEYLAALSKILTPGEAQGRAADAADAAASDTGGEAGAGISELLRTRTREDAERARREAIETLDQIGRGLAAMPGPKTVVLFSDGYDGATLEGTLRTTVGQMNRAGARVYTVDTKGLAGPPGDVMNSLAIDTGGLTLFNENDLGRALDTVAADTNTYYVLGYQPLDARYDGKYREIDVRVKRSGLKVRARKGYVALPPSRMLLPKPIK